MMEYFQTGRLLLKAIYQPSHKRFHSGGVKRAYYYEAVDTNQYIYKGAGDISDFYFTRTLRPRKPHILLS